MASLQLTLGIEVALGGKAAFTVDPSDVEGKVEIWERTILFPSVGSPVVVPKFKKNPQVFGSTASLTQPAQLGGLYQVLLYKEGEGRSDGGGDVLDRRSFPSVKDEGGRTNFLTKCTERPQIDIIPGGTFLAMSFAGSAITMARVQLGSDKPDVGTGNVPVFPEGTVVADTFSVPDVPKFVHQMQPTDRRIMPGSTLFFVVFTWDINGNWDYIWGFEGIAPASTKKDITTLQRTFTAKMLRLDFIDDSDDLSNGEGRFTLVVQQGANSSTAVVTTDDVWIDTFETGTSLTLSPPITVTTGPAVIIPDTYDVSIQVQGLDNDQPSFPTDLNDTAETDLISLDLPIGQGKEEVIDRHLSLDSHVTGGDDTLSFAVDLIWSVTYS